MEGLFGKMGVSIHFEGQLNDETAYKELLSSVAEIARIRCWLTETIDPVEKTLSRIRGEEDWDYTGPVKGVIVYIHEDCDPVRLEFDNELYVQEFAKTQFAGLECHLKVIDLLKAIRPYFRELTVEDEGEYWETNDRTILAAHLNRSHQAIEEELRKNPSAQVKVKTPNGRIMDLIE
jgi:hypothetical protein